MVLPTAVCVTEKKENVYFKNTDVGTSIKIGIVDVMTIMTSRKRIETEQMILRENNITSYY